MATFTANYNFALPQVGSDKNAWGNYLNTNWNSLDTTLKAVQTVSNAALPKAGGTMTGNVTFNGAFTVTLGRDPTSPLETTTKQYVDAADAALSTRVTTAQTQADLGVTNAATAQAGANASVKKSGDTMTGTLGIAADLSLTGTPRNLNIASAKIIGNATQIGFSSADGTKTALMTNANGDFSVTGQLYATGNVSAFSDARIKTNVVTIHEALGLVERMRGVLYTRIDTNEHGVGVIAQEMEEVLPQVVSRNGEYKAVAYGNLVGVLIEAVKELSARVKELEAK